MLNYVVSMLDMIWTSFHTFSLHFTCILVQNRNFYLNMRNLRKAGKKTNNFISPIFLYFKENILRFIFPEFQLKVTCPTRPNSSLNKGYKVIDLEITHAEH